MLCSCHDCLVLVILIQTAAPAECVFFFFFFKSWRWSCLRLPGGSLRQALQHLIALSVPFGKSDCSELQSVCSTLSRCPNYHERKIRRKQAHHQSKAAQESSRSLPVMTSPSGCILKALNNSYSHTSCFYSRRLRPQTPQGSDDEGGKSTLTIPPLCVSAHGQRGTLQCLHGTFILWK